jgi:hypothetical protein
VTSQHLWHILSCRQSMQEQFLIEMCPDCEFSRILISKALLCKAQQSEQKRKKNKEKKRTKNAKSRKAESTNFFLQFKHKKLILCCCSCPVSWRSCCLNRGSSSIGTFTRKTHNFEMNISHSGMRI